MLALAAETLFGAVAALCSIIGIAMAILSHIAGRRNAAEQAADELHEKLLAEQRRSEELSAELHRLRMEELS